MGKIFKRKYRKRAEKTRSKKTQKGGAFGAGMALGMFLPQILGTVSTVLKVNV